MSWDDALGETERLLRAAGSNVVFALSGSESNELAYGLARFAAALGGTVLLPEKRVEPLGRPLSDLARASVELESEVPLEEAAPIAALWLKEGARNGAGGAGEAIALRVPRTPNGIGVAHAVARGGAGTRTSRAPSTLFVSGDEAVADPAVRALAESAQSVIATTMFQGLVVGWADVVLPGTSYLERDGSTTNMEGRVQRLRRAVIPPAPDELAWLAKLAERFDLELSPYAAVVYEELFGRPFSELGETAPLAGEFVAQSLELEPRPAGAHLVRYRPLFSGAAVERVENLQFQRPDAGVELSPDDAQRLGVRDGDDVNVRTNGTSVTLRARVREGLAAGVVLVPEEHAGELADGPVEVTRSG
jgi:hypothetical protein